MSLPPHSDVRWRPDVGFELRCDSCTRYSNQTRYWPLTLEFWNPRRGMQMCRACQLARNAANARRRYGDPTIRRRKQQAVSARRRRVRLAAFRSLRRAAA